MAEHWTPEENAEWQARYAVAPVGSQERALLDDMRETGQFVPLVPVTPPPDPFWDHEPPAEPVQQTGIPPNAGFNIIIPHVQPAVVNVAPTPIQPAGVPPKFPVPPPAQDPNEAVTRARMNAFFNRQPAPTAEQEAAIRLSAQPGPQVPPGGIGFGTRRNVGPLGVGGRMKTRKSKKGGQIVTMFFNIRDQVKIYHWQTKSFAEHKATDELIGTLDTNIDKFVEVYMGHYGRPLIKKTLPVKNLTVTGIRAFITRSTNWLSTTVPRMVKKTDSDLLNIRDEILADLNQVKYLFTLS